MYVVLMHDIILFFILLCCNLYLKMLVGLFLLFLLCCNLYLKMHVGLKSSRELKFVLFVNVPTLNKTFDLI